MAVHESNVNPIPNFLEKINDLFRLVINECIQEVKQSLQLVSSRIRKFSDSTVLIGSLALQLLE